MQDEVPLRLTLFQPQHHLARDAFVVALHT